MTPLSPVYILPEGRLYPGTLLIKVTWVRCPLHARRLRRTGGPLPQEVTGGVTDVTGKVGQDDVGCLRGPGHRRLDQVEVGLVSHLLAVIIQLLEILCVQRRQSLAGVLRLGAAKLCEISLLVPSSLKKSEMTCDTIVVSAEADPSPGGCIGRV